MPLRESPYTELAAATNFSFLAGASSPADMVEAAIALGHGGIGIADRNSVAGVVRAWSALKEAREDGLARDFKLLTGARLVFADGTPDCIAYPLTRRGWGRLTRLLTTGNLRAKKGECTLFLADLLDWAEEWAVVILPGPCGDSFKQLGDNPAQIPPGTGGWHAQRDGGGGADMGILGRIRHAPSTTRLCEWSPSPFRGGLFTLLANRIQHLWLGAAMPRAGRDRRRLAQLKALSAETGIPLIAINDALYATPEQRPLADLLACIREGTTIQKAGKLLAANAERHLKPAAEMTRLFADCPEALAEIPRLMALVTFDLSQLAYEYPHEPCPPGYTPQVWLEELTRSTAAERWPEGVPPKLATLIEEELEIIGRLNYAPYFLTVHDIVRYAQGQGILCQGRGSAANSAVCFVLGITAVDPAKHSLLFSRFISEERREPPDIDVDFEHERREEVMQYIYRRYGRERAGIVATVIHYRPRSAVREMGKALGLTEDVTARLSSTVWGSYSSKSNPERWRETGFDPDNPEIARLNQFVQQVLNFPRHLSQHVGGFVLTEDRLDETVPIHNAAMEDRTFIEWDKDDIDALGLMKVDVLALGMLTCIRKAFDMLAQSPSPLAGEGRERGSAVSAAQETQTMKQESSSDKCRLPLSPTPLPQGERGFQLTLQSIPDDDTQVWDMLCRGDSVGVFQVESRAQMNMLPRLRPRCFYDLAIQVAIVRPGPIQGDMVHPYLRRRQGREAVDFPSPAPPYDPDELREVLGKTLGVPLFQEQAMKLAIVAAEFTPSESNQLRRAMATFRNLGKIQEFQAKLVQGMVRRGYDEEFAARCFKQIEGFGSYGFPESHAIAFARLVWVSSWIKCHHPAVFAAALLNSQPMGFYAPAQIVRDAREHGVVVRGPDVNESGWDNGVRPFRGQFQDASMPPHNGLGKLSPKLAPNLILGLRQIDGFREDWGRRIEAARPFRDVEDLARRATLPQRALKLLADADAFGSLAMDRRAAGWDVLRDRIEELPLFAFSGTVSGSKDAAPPLVGKTIPEMPDLRAEPAMALPAMRLGEEVAADYQTVRLSLKAHPMHILRPVLDAEGVLPCARLRDPALKAGWRVRVAGVVLVRQRPGNGKAIFLTLEDEDAVANIVMFERTFERHRRAVMSARLMEVEGEVQKSPEGVIHVMAHRVVDRSALLATLSEAHEPQITLSRADEFLHPQHPRQKELRAGHPRNVRTFPKSRDFH